MTSLRHLPIFLVDCGSLRAQHFSLFAFLSCNANIFCPFSAMLSHFLSCRFWEIQYFWEETTTQIYFRWWWKQTKTKWKTFFFALFRNSKSREWVAQVSSIRFSKEQSSLRHKTSISIGLLTEYGYYTAVVVSACITVN